MNIVQHNGHGVHRHGRHFYFFNQKQHSNSERILMSIFKDEALYCKFSIAHLLRMKNFDELPKIAQKKEATDAQKFIEEMQNLHKTAKREIYEKHANVKDLLCAYVRKKCIERIERLKRSFEITDLECNEQWDTAAQKKKKKKNDYLRLCQQNNRSE